MLNKHNLVVTALAAAATVAFMVITPADAANEDSGAFKLEGAWIAKGVGFPLQWTYVLSFDPSGRRASLHGSIDVGLGGSGFDADRGSPLLGELVMTGPDTAKFISVWYGLKTTPPGSPVSAQIVYIGVNKGDVKFTGPGKGTASHHIAYYLPSSDADGDGLPDQGTTPALGPIPITTFDTRLPAPE